MTFDWINATCKLISGLTKMAKAQQNQNVEIDKCIWVKMKFDIKVDWDCSVWKKMDLKYFFVGLKTL